MMTPDLFVKLGLFVRQGFLDAPECARICGEMLATPSKPAGVFKNGERVIESTVRRTLNVSVSASTRGSIERALDALASDARATSPRRPRNASGATAMGSFLGPRRRRSSRRDSMLA